jgi:hypothetical protein
LERSGWNRAGSCAAGSGRTSCISSLPYPTFASDLGEALTSLARFHQKGVAYEALLAGHGEPIVRGAREHVTRFLQERGVLAAPSGRLPVV